MIGVPTGPLIQGTSGVWTNVTPGGIDLDPTSNSNDTFGIQDILADPVTSGVFYAFTCYNGLWRSTDYGETWTRRSTVGDGIDFGKAWGGAIAPDGTIYTTLGNSFQGSPEGRKCVFKSTDGGINFTRSSNTTKDPYNISLDPNDPTISLCGTHDDDSVLESTDSGASYSVVLDIGTGGTGGYVQHLSSTKAIYVGQDSDDVYLMTKSGTWSSAAIATLANAGHGHGAYQGYLDPTTQRYYHPSGSNTGNDGIWTGESPWTSFTQRYSTSGESAIIATASTLYAMFSFPSGGGATNPRFTTDARSDGTTWAAPTDPTGLDNGAKRFAVGTDGVRWVVIGGMWNHGIWRYVE
jgi:hypothetical protein